jgi:hypothetical protein
MLIGSMGWGTYRSGMASNRHAHQGTYSITLLKADHHDAQASILAKLKLINLNSSYSKSCLFNK